MATTEELVRAERQIRKSAEALGKALDAVETYAEPAVARSVQATKNFYDRIDAEFGLLSGSEVGRLLGSQTSTPRNRALDTRRAGRIVAIRRGNKLLYPGFQFDENGQPLEVITRLRSLAEEADWSETGIVQWLCSPTTYLEGRRPVDLLTDDSDRVLEIARLEWSAEW